MSDDVKKVLAEATPRPWRPAECNPLEICSESRIMVAGIIRMEGQTYGNGQREANAELIVIAVNSYEADQERIRVLEQWKSEALESLAKWDAVDAFVRNSPDCRLGAFVQDEALRLLTISGERQDRVRELEAQIDDTRTVLLEIRADLIKGMAVQS